MIQKLFVGIREAPNLFVLVQLHEHRHQHNLHNLLPANLVLIVVALIDHAQMGEPQCFGHRVFDQQVVGFFYF